ncbi:sugar phosphate isomerase/epimerase [Frankia sp. ACN10a]|uniref:sugar phosphate isomerase/epimerase family protein n=1 Tax=Frankia sp. ACN10a TaxID=2926031 RepID=UPI002119106D|nr:sugar phosphate isomerase/epimerase [Frankia sp. ACN10a]
MNLGINLCFAVKRHLEPERWAEFVRSDLDLDMVQVTFDLLDPWWPERERDRVARRIADAAAAWDLTIHSAYVGLAHYVPAGLLDPDPQARAVALTWWRRACDVTALLGARAVGGPLGTLSVHDAADPDRRARRYAELLDSLVFVADHAAAAGLVEFLVEPTPVAREIPSTVEQAEQLMRDLAGHTAVPVGLTLDIGHTYYQPLYGPDCSPRDWIRPLNSAIRLVHLDNTDGLGDPHWGWPHPLGGVNVADIGADLRDFGLGDVPVVLEVYPRFEDDDDQVRRTIASSVAHCTEQLTR